MIKINFLFFIFCTFEINFYFLSVVFLKMAFVLVDSDIYRITIQIVEDFIGEDYDAFIENGPTDDIKLIKWELSIYFKKLEDKKKSIVEYYIIPIYKHIKEDLYHMSDGRYMYIGQYGSYDSKKYYNALTIDFEKNISNKTITIKFICDETRKTGYINQIRFILNRLMGHNGLMCRDDNTRGYYKTSKEEKGSAVDLLKGKSILLKDIVKTHYSEILKNIEAYILYCKTEKIDIDFKKIVDRITFIKEYVRENYDITLV